MTRLQAAFAALALAMQCAVATPAQAGIAQPLVDDTALEARVNALSAQLRCLVCQNQSLADSHAGLALDLKTQVREQLRAGRDEAQVVDYLTRRYGDFVLYKPPLKATTWLLWTGPALLAFLGVAMVLRSLTLRVPANDAGDSEAQRSAALEWLKEDNANNQPPATWR